MTWPEQRLSEIVEFVYGRPLREKDRDGDGYPVVGSNGPVGLHSEPLVDEGPVIVVGRKGTAGSVTWVDGPCSPIDTTYYIHRLDESMPWRFLYLVLEFANLPAVTAQTGVPGLNRDRAGELKVPIPPVEVQHRIVDLIDHIDAVKAGHSASAEAGRGLRRPLFHELTDAADASDVLLTECVDILDRLRQPVSKAERQTRPGDVPYYGAAGRAGWIDEAIFDEDLVLLGEDAIDFHDPTSEKAYTISGPAWVNNHAHVLRPKPCVVDWRYLKHALDAVNYAPFASMGTRTKLTQGKMKQITLCLPELKVQRQIASAVDSSLDLAAKHDVVRVRLDSFRSVVLRELLTGGHEVPKAYDRLIEEVAA